MIELPNKKQGNKDIFNPDISRNCPINYNDFTKRGAKLGQS